MVSKTELRFKKELEEEVDKLKSLLNNI